MLQENFWKDKDLVKKIIKQKKTFEEILKSYQKSANEIKNLKELYNLGVQEQDEEVIIDCNVKLDEVYENQ